MLSEGARVLAVDDVPANVEVLESMLTPYGYDVTGALSANEALESISARLPDIVLVDVVMPGVDGLELCRTLRADPSTRFLPIILITAGGERQRVQGLTAGADDFLVKPIDRGELLARVRSLVRIKDYHDTMQRQADELAAWNRRLETRVQEQVEQLQRLGRLRQFLSPQVADLLISTEGETLLETHRRQIAVVSCSLPGFRALAETSAPEEVVGLLSEYYLAVGNISFGYSASVGPFAGDRVSLYFNDPLPVDNPADQAITLALALRSRMYDVSDAWSRRGLSPGFAVGIDVGYATLGTLGFAGRQEYAAVGLVVDVATGLSEQARAGQILATDRALAGVSGAVDVGPARQVALPGFTRTVSVVEVRSAGDRPRGAHDAALQGPLSEREREVVGLIARGYSNREIAQQLTIAEGTAVRHVANILNKLGFRSRAQVAVWAVQHNEAAVWAG